MRQLAFIPGWRAGLPAICRPHSRQCEAGLTVWDRVGIAGRQARCRPSCPGDRDTTLSPVNGGQVIAQARAATDLKNIVSRGQVSGGMSYTRTVETDGSGRPVLEQWVLQGAGHAWFSDSAADSYTEPRGPDASRERMSFFLERSTTEASVQ